jgi:hypothetical protein
VSFFSLSLSVGISPGLVPEAKSVCVFWSWDLRILKDPFSVTREQSDSPSDHSMKKEEDQEGRGDLMTRTVINNVHWKGIKAPELGL